MSEREPSGSQRAGSTYWRDLHQELQDPEFKDAYLAECLELGTDPDLEVIERLAKGQEQADE